MQVEKINTIAKIASIIFVFLVFATFIAVIQTMSVELYLVELVFVILAAISRVVYCFTGYEIEEDSCK